MLNSFRNSGRGYKRDPYAPTRFLSFTSKVHMKLQKCSLLVLRLLPFCCKISRSCLVPVLNYEIWTKATQKNGFSGHFFVKKEVVISSLIEISKLWLHVHICNYDVITFNSNYFYFKETWSSQFCWHFKIAIMLI